MTSIIDQIRATSPKNRKNKNGWLVCCPAHDDKTPSLSVEEILYDNGERRIALKCFAGCSHRAVKDAYKQLHGIDLNTTNSFYYCPIANNFKPLPGPDPDDYWTYFNEQGDILAVNCRYDDGRHGKRFVPYSPWGGKNGDYEWQQKPPPDPRPLYGLDRLAQNPDKPVLIVEGEKTADAARVNPLFADYVPMTWMGGVQAVGKTDYSPCKGHAVVIWPDNDNPGKKAAEKLADLIAAAGARSVSIVELPASLPDKWDLADEIPPELDILEVIQKAKKVIQPLSAMIVSALQLAEMDLPKRESIIDSLLKTSSLNMLYAVRGLGKTWIALWMAISIARGEKFLEYSVPKARNVLFIDGEMPLSDLKARVRALGAEDTSGLYFLPSESLHLNDRPLNIQNDGDQQRIVDALHELKEQGINIEVLIFDNLSSLSSGVDENDNTEQEDLLRWFMHLRHMGYAVVLVHHAGKSGDQRGASRREDLLDTVMKLEKDQDEHPGDVQGAHFIFTFTKTRGETPKPYALDVLLTANFEGVLSFTMRNAANISAGMKVLKCIQNKNPKTQKALALLMKKSTGSVSQHMKKLEERNYVQVTEQGLKVTAAGLRELARLWPQDYSEAMAQAEAEEEDEIPF